ncbi:MAG: hypothetical protein AB7F76_05280 [Parvibaculaceae bacterium]
MTPERKRLKALARVLKVQSELHRIEERKLSMLLRREVELDGEREDLIAALNEHDKFYGSFIYPMAKRLRAVDEAADLNRRAKERTARQTTIQGTRKKQMERLHAAAAQLSDRADEQRDLLEAVERAARGKTSLP